MIESRKMEITAEHKQEETSSISGMAGTVAVIGNFEKADALTIIAAKGFPEANLKLGDNAEYEGSKSLQYIFKRDPKTKRPGASKVIAIQPGTRTKASLTLDVDENELNLEAISGGKWGNNINISLTEGTDRDYQFLCNLNDKINRYDNKTINEIVDRVNSSNPYLTAKLTPKSTNTFTEVSDTPLTGGTESTNLTIEDYTKALDFIIKEDIDILIFSDIRDDSFNTIVAEFLEDKKKINNRSISLGLLTPDDTIDSKIATVENSRSTDMFFINQKSQINDEELNESESIARMTGIIAGTPVTDSLSKQPIGDIQKVDPILTDKEVDDLTDKGIMCLELLNRENKEYGVYSSVSSCIDTNDKGEKVAESELHAVRSEIYVEKYFNKILKETQGKTGKELTLLGLNSVLNQAKEDLIKERIIVSLDVNAFPDTEDRDRFIIKYTGVVRGIVNRIHNVYSWTME